MRSKGEKSPEFWTYLAAVLVALCALTLIAGVVMAYASRGDGTSWVDSHYRFQIRTFWIGTLIALAGGVATLVIVVLIPLSLWLLIRCIRGLKFLSQGAPHPNPASWLIG